MSNTENWYIDFDSTLYNTNELIIDMLNTITNHITKSRNLDEKTVFKEINSMFNRENIYNIFTLCKYFENKYLLPANSLSNKINTVLRNGSKYVYDDVKPFLKELKKGKNDLYILTYVSGSDNMDFQTQKVYGSGITTSFDCIIMTAKQKDSLDLIYENGIFVDDNPKDLENFYKANAKKVIRLRRPNGRYSHKSLNIPEIEEYSTLSEILFDKEKEEEQNL